LGSAWLAALNFSNHTAVPIILANELRRTNLRRCQRPRDRCTPLMRETALASTHPSASRPPNGFLSALSADDFELIRPHLRTVDLSEDLVLVEIDDTLKRAYLPHRGVISLVVKLARGEQIQVAMIGRDSVFGAFSALGDPIALNSAVVLIPGVASALGVDRLRDAADQSTTFRATLMRHGLAVYAQIQQTVGCNSSHSVESRLARCLLQTRDFAGSDKLFLTQESMAQMIGARRNSVSLVANTLQQANLIHYSRGHLELNDPDSLRRSACECYATVKAQYDRLLRPRCDH
jgi:CRP-like cAMP-binding protein